MLTDEQIKALRDGCEGVTPGPWRYGGTDNPDSPWAARTVHLPNGGFMLHKDEQPEIAAHIARCDPDTIRELCTRVLIAEALVESGRVGAISDKEIIDELKEECAALQARVKVLEQSEIVGREVLLPVKREASFRLMRHAEAAGYRKGVEDAAKHLGAVLDARRQLGQFSIKIGEASEAYHVLANVHASILALLEQTSEANAMRKK